MIEKMRELAQSTASRVLIGLIIVLLLLFGYGSFDVFNAVDTSVAKVDGVEIERREYEREVQLQRRMNEDKVDDTKLQHEILENMIKRSLLLGTGAKLNLAVDAADIDRRITTDAAFVENGRFSETLFRQRLMNAGLRPADYRRSLTDAAVIEQLEQGIGASEFLTPVELRRIEALINQQRDVAWVDVDPAAFAAQVQVDDAGAKRYFDANQRRFQVPESVVVDYIRIGRASVGAGITVSDADIGAEYARAVAESKRQGAKRHAAHIMLENRPGRSQAQAIALLQAAAKRIAAGEDFGAVARQVSEDAGTKEQGGDLGVLGRGELPEPALDAALWKLSLGQVSAPVVSRAGVHLLKVLEIEAPTFPPLAEVREQLQARLLEQKIKDRLTTIRGELTDLAYEQDLHALAKRYGVAVERSGAIPRTGVVAGIGGNAAVRTAAFSNDVRDGTFNSSVLDVDGDLVVLRLVSHHDARAMTLAEALPRVKAALTQDRLLALARQRAQQLIDGVRSTGSLTPSVQALGVTWQSRAQVQRGSAEVPPEVLRVAFELPRPVDANKASGRVVALQNGHVAAVVVTRVADGIPSTNPAEQDSLRSFLANQSGQRQFMAFIDRLEAKADIERKNARVPDEGAAAGQDQAPGPAN